MAKTAAKTAAKTPPEPAQAQASDEGEVLAQAAVVAPAEPVDHKGLLEELAGHIRDIPLPGRNKHVTGLLAFLADHHL